MQYGALGNCGERPAKVCDSDGVEIHKVFCCDTETGFVNRADVDPVTGQTLLNETRDAIKTVNEWRAVPLSVVFLDEIKDE